MVENLQVAWRGGLSALFLVTALAHGAMGQDSEPTLGQVNAERVEEAEAAARRDSAWRRAEGEAEAQARAQREARQHAAQATAREAEAMATQDLERALSDAHALQQDLFLLRQDPGSAPPSTDGPGVADTLSSEAQGYDPRVASRVPPERHLPPNIFDRSNAVIPPGTWQNRESLRVSRLVLDADGDGQPEVVRFLDRATGDRIREEADRNYDGVIDAWKSYREGELVGRVLDENDDGNPDVFEVYAAGLLVVRQLDRDDDGVRDVFYRYRGEALFEEGHDANNDGAVDLLIVYAERRRLRAEEDVDRDGRMDLWTRYAAAGQGEEITQIERDRAGRGYADTFEYFRTEDGRALLVRRERDIDGDGGVDVVSFYEGGRLHRRQINDPSLLPL